VHSLNQGNVASVPGLIFMNQRGVWKHGYSWASLIRVNDESTPSLVWPSRYGSVTFNPFGKELPDGGVNEAGLFIWEMSFDTQYPSDSTKPMLFQCQWMQYVLDNFSTTEEVIANASRMALDGWGWHYFVADSSGHTAIIDFVDGEPVVHTGRDMPVPLCCNSSYPVAMTWLKQHEGFGGELAIRRSQEEIPRFIYGAKLLTDYSTQDPVEYAFHVLREMSSNVRWSVVHDVNHATTYFSTNLNEDVRHFEMSPADFGGDRGAWILDIENPGPGDVRGKFVPYNREMNTHLLREVFALMCDMGPEFRKTLLEDNRTDLDELALCVSERMEGPDVAKPYRIQGNWAGTVSYPSADGWTQLPMTLVLRADDGSLYGTIHDSLLLKNVSTTNTVYRGGLLSFTIAAPGAPDLLYYQLHFTADEIKGSIAISSTEKKGSLHLQRRSRDSK
jgi:choloylglycine hydrolase